MAHTLWGYDGKCRNIHGHNYKLFVTVEGQPVKDNFCAAGMPHLLPHNPKQGMVMDFGDIKHLVEKHIIDVFDHAFVVPEGSPYSKLTDTKLITVPYQPTCENLLLDFASRLDGKLPEGVRLYSLRLHETNSSYAELSW